MSMQQQQHSIHSIYYISSCTSNNTFQTSVKAPPKATVVSYMPAMMINPDLSELDSAGAEIKCSHNSIENLDSDIKRMDL